MLSKRRIVGLVVSLVVAAAVAWTQGVGPGDQPVAGSGESSAAESSVPASGTDPDSGLRVVQVGDLPAEAHDTLDLIDSGGPYPYEEDGATFHNYEGVLPDHEDGYYREFTVETPGSEDRGARRIVAGSSGELYWTDDHYASFARIQR